jgi:hypothetical protein
MNADHVYVDRAVPSTCRGRDLAPGSRHRKGLAAAINQEIRPRTWPASRAAQSAEHHTRVAVGGCGATSKPTARSLSG